jgi:SnoaL-like domain
MSQQNVEIVRRGYALLDEGDLAGVIELYHENAEWRDLQHAPDTPEVVRGRSAILALWTQWMEVFDDFKAEPYEFIDAHRLRERPNRPRRPRPQGVGDVAGEAMTTLRSSPATDEMGEVSAYF